MAILSWPFAGLVFLTAVLRRVLPERSGRFVLLAAGLFFCLQNGPTGLLMMASALVSLAAARLIGHLMHRERRGAAKGCAAIAAGMVCLGIAFGRRLGGCAFWMLIHLTWILDALREEEAPRRPMEILTASLFFPAMLQGPIMRGAALSERIGESERPLSGEASAAMLRVLMGLCKKLILADRLSLMTEAVFADPSAFSAPVLWTALLGYAVEIYADFSGCMDIVIGAAKLLGVQLDENFRQPYLAVSFSDYWKRWHISLGAWFRRYVFYPLALQPFCLEAASWGSLRTGRRLGRVTGAAIPMMITWLLVGFWHGGGHYLLWGAVNGGILLLEGALESGGKENRKWTRILRTFLAGLLIRVLFRSASLADAVTFYKGLFSLCSGKGLFSCGLDEKDLVLCAVGTILLILRDLCAEKGKTPCAPCKGVLAFLGVAALLIFGCYGPGYDPAAFYYSRF